MHTVRGFFEIFGGSPHHKRSCDVITRTIFEKRTFRDIVTHSILHVQRKSWQLCHQHLASSFKSGFPSTFQLKAEIWQAHECGVNTAVTIILYIPLLTKLKLEFIYRLILVHEKKLGSNFPFWGLLTCSTFILPFPTNLPHCVF